MLRKTWLLLALLFLLSAAWAVPNPPANLRAERSGNSVNISWQHVGGEGVSFNVYKGHNLNELQLVANVPETSFFDVGLSYDKEYFYAVKAVDSSGESSASAYIAIEIPPKEEKPFSVELVEPKKSTFTSGEEVEFVVRVESKSFQDLLGLKAVLVSEQLGLEEGFAFDSEQKLFTLAFTMPEIEEETIRANFTIQVSATVGGQEYLEPITGPLTVVPVRVAEPWQYAWNILLVIGPPFFVLFIISTFIFVAWRWFLSKKAEKDKIRLELLEVHKERALWKYDLLKRRVTREQFVEKERELQGKQRALEQKLGIAVGRKGIAVRANPFEGYTREEIREIYQLTKLMRPQAKEMGRDKMRAWLVGRGKSERVARKVVEFIFRH